MHSNPSKVLFVITKSNFGGAQRYVFDLAHALHQGGADVTVLLGGQGVLLEKLTRAHIRTISIPYLTRDINLLTDIKTFFAFLKYIHQIRPDVLHVNSAKAGGLGALAGRLLMVPHIVFTAHGWAFNEERGTLSKKVIRLFSWATIFLAHTTIAVSDAALAQIPAWLSRKVVVIKNGVQEISFHPKEDARKMFIERCPGLTAHAHAQWIGTIAELHHVKGLSYAIEAILLLKEQRYSGVYVIVGEGDLRTHLEATIEEYGLEDTVFLAGFVEDAASYLPAFDLFVLPSISEGLGYVLLEAGLANLPVVASAVGGIPEIITHKENGLLVTPKNATEIASAIHTIMEDSGMRTRYASALHSLTKGPFAFNTMYQETKKVYGMRS